MHARMELITVIGVAVSIIKKCTFEGKALDVKKMKSQCPVSYRTLTLELINTL